MKKPDFVAYAANKAGMTQKDTEKALNAILQSVEELLQQGEKIQLAGFGTFETAEHKARIRRNPRTGEPVPIAAAIVPAFRPGKQLKEKMNHEIR